MSRNNTNSAIIQLLLAGFFTIILVSIAWIIIFPPSEPAENHNNISAGGAKSFFNNEPPEKLIYDTNSEIKANNKKSYTIAVVVPSRNTNNGEEALEILRGVALAQKKFNSPDSPVQLRVLIAKEIVGENGSNEEIAKALVKDKKVLGVVGHFSTGATETAVKVYNNQPQKDKLVSISPTSTGTNISNGSGYFFRTVPNNTVAANKLANYVIQTLRITNKKVAVFYDSSNRYSQSLCEAFIKPIESSNIDTHNKCSDPKYDISQGSSRISDAEEALLDAIDKKTTVIMFAFDSNKRGKATIILRPQKRTEEVQLRYFLGGDGIYSHTFLTDNQIKARNMVFAVPWHRSIINVSRSKEFVEASNERWGSPSNDEKVTWRTATAYDATKALIEAINQAIKSGSNPTRESIQKHLSLDFKMTGVTGDIEFENNGDIKGGTKLVIACEIPGKQQLEFRLVEQCPSK